MSGLESLGELKTYLKTRRDDVVSDLYKPCLSHADTYVRGAGYFSSSVFSLMTEDLLRFCINGGKIILLTSTELQKQDLEAIKNAGTINPSLADNFLDILEFMLSDEKLREPVEMLIALLHSKKLELKIGVLKGKIYHEKKGYFSDNFGNYVSFDGSGNETRSGIEYWLGNAESFNVSYSWDAQDWNKRGIVWKEDLDSTLNGNDFPVETIDSIDPDFLGKWEIESNLESHSLSAKKRQKKLEEKWEEIYGKSQQGPKTDQENLLQGFQIDGITLRNHQKKAIEIWIKKGKKGILEHATGSGKTITALSIIKSEISLGTNVVVMVPGKELLYQWQTELETHIPEAVMGLLGDGNDDQMLGMMRTEEDEGVILIAIGDSLSKDGNVESMKLAIKNLKNGFLFVCDECHKIGANRYAKFLDVSFKMTLGLSATPERQGDLEGTERIYSILGNIIHKYSLQEAFKDKHLSKFNYHVKTAYLTLEEEEKYKQLNKQLIQKLHGKKKGSSIDNYTKLLIRQMRDIIRSASAKFDVVIDILRNDFKTSEFKEYWLIYASDGKMMNALKNRIMEELGHDVLTYWSAQNRKDRKMTLQYFEKNGGLMLAIKCLDEGVDIPSISHGIVISSTKTRREWIQRRGRLLRKSDSKTHSEIYDILTLPDSTEKSGAGFLLHELERAEEFSENASNYYKIRRELQDIKDEFEWVEEVGEEE